MNLDKTTEITIAAEGVVTISTTEYGQLVACRTMLDMILSSRRDSGYTDSAVANCAHELRKLHADTPLEKKENPEGEEDAE